MHKLLVCETKIICHTLQWVLYISYFDNTKLSSQSSHFKGTLNSIFTIMNYQNCGLAFDFLENRFSEVTCADWSWHFKHAFLYLLYTVSHRRANKLNWLMLFLSLAIWWVFQNHQRYQDRHEKRSRWIHLQFNLPYYPKISLAEGTGELISDFHDVVWFLYLFSFFYVVKRSRTEYFQHWAPVKTDRPKQQLSLAAITYTVRNKSLSDAKNCERPRQKYPRFLLAN